MSSQRGNVQRKRPQKHKNEKAFKNNMHTTSKQIEKLNNLEMHGLCERCKAIIEWKIKYKKYKPLTKPSTCVKCSQRNIKRAYFIVCEGCITKLGVCGKCGQQNDVVIPLPDPKKDEEKKMFEERLRAMRERERRTIFRLMEKGEDPTAKVSQYLENLDLESNVDDSEFSSEAEEGSVSDDTEE